MKNYLVLLSLALLISPTGIFGATADLGLKPTSVHFADNNEVFIVGATERVYVAVANYGTVDVSGTVIIYRDNQVVGEKSVSVPFQGLADEVFADFVVPDHPFRLYFELKGIDPEDNNTSNNQFLAQLYEVAIDTDRDGSADSVDTDDDNDGLSDTAEDSIGTNPLKQDTDGDGYNDSIDAYPLDPTKHLKEVPKVEVPKEEVKAEVRKEAVIQPVQPTKKTEAATKTNVTTPPATETPSGDDELVSDFYQTGEVTLFNQINIHAQQVNWNTYDFSFTTNLPDLDINNLEYLWVYGDGLEGTKSGHHTYQKTGEYYVTLKVKGPWDSYFYDSVKVQVEFWSVFNYWLWLFVLAIALSVILFGTSFKHHDRTITVEEKTIAKRIKREPKNKKEDKADE